MDQRRAMGKRKYGYSETRCMYRLSVDLTGLGIHVAAVPVKKTCIPMISFATLETDLQKTR